jgi:hypothetical protein
MAGLQSRRPGVVVEHQGGPEASGAHPHLHTEVEEARVAVPHPELAEECGHHLPGARAPRHRQGLVLNVRPEAPCVHFYRCLWTKLVPISLHTYLPLTLDPRRGGRRVLPKCYKLSYEETELTAGKPIGF